MLSFGCILLVQKYAFMNECIYNIPSYIFQWTYILNISQIKDLSTSTKHVNLRHWYFTSSSVDKYHVWLYSYSCLLWQISVTNICDKYQVWIFWDANGSLHIPVCCEAFQFSHSSVPICSLFWSSKMNLEYSKDLEWLALLNDFEEIKLKIQKHRLSSPFL